MKDALLIMGGMNIAISFIEGIAKRWPNAAFHFVVAAFSIVVAVTL